MAIIKPTPTGIISAATLPATAGDLAGGPAPGRAGGVALLAKAIEAVVPLRVQRVELHIITPASFNEADLAALRTGVAGGTELAAGLVVAGTLAAGLASRVTTRRTLITLGDGPGDKAAVDKALLSGTE